MIAVIGGVKTTVRLKMTPPERDIEKQKKQDEEALIQAGIDINSLGGSNEAESDDSFDARFRQYYEQKLREQSSENYWSEVGLGDNDFGGYPVCAPEENADIKVISSGCSYTVARLLGAKAADVCFISVVGNDALGLAAKAELAQAGVDVSGIKTMEGATPVGIEIHNIVGDLQLCRENNLLAEAITPEIIDEYADILSSAEGIFLDGSIPVETLNYISEKYADNCPVYFDPGSTFGGSRYAESKLRAACVMPGRMEAEVMTGSQVLGVDQLMAAGEAFEERGTSKMVITLKGGGLYYRDGAESGIIKPERRLSFADTTGSGDVLSAELVYGLNAGKDLKTTAQAAMDCVAEYLRDVEDIR